MTDVRKLTLRIAMWDGENEFTDSELDLEGIMADLHALSGSQASIVSSSAEALLNKGVPDLPAVQCLIYVIHGLDFVQREQAWDYIDHASNKLSGLKAAASRLGLMIPREDQLIADIEDLRQRWSAFPPVEPAWYIQYCAPTLAEVQRVLNRMRRPGTKHQKANEQGWRCVQYLGSCTTYSVNKLWTLTEGPSAAGLLRDPTYKLLNLLMRSRLSDGEGLDLAALQREVIICEELEATFFNPAGNMAEDPADDMEHSAIDLETPTKARNTTKIHASNSMHTAPQQSTSQTIHSGTPTKASRSSSISSTHTTIHHPTDGVAGDPITPADRMQSRDRATSFGYAYFGKPEAAEKPSFKPIDHGWQPSPSFANLFESGTLNLKLGAPMSPMPPPLAESEGDREARHTPGWGGDLLQAQEKESRRVDKERQARRKKVRNEQYGQRPASSHFPPRGSLVRSHRMVDFSRAMELED